MQEPEVQSPEVQTRWTFEDIVATVAMGILVAITAANVAVRYLTDVSFAWTEEISVIVMVLMVFAGASSSALREGHIRMDLLSQRGSAEWQATARWIGRGATALAFGVLAALMFKTALEEFRYNDLNSLNLPRWWFTVPEAIVCVLVCLRALGWGRRAVKEGEQ